MKTLGLFYFSATNNTKLISQMIASNMEKKYEVHDYKIESIIKDSIDINFDDYDLVGIGMPIYGFAIADIIYDFIKLINGRSKIFLFLTAGGYSSMNYNCTAALKRKLLKQGHIIFYERIFLMGSNWLISRRDEVILLLHDLAKEKVAHMCLELESNKERYLKANIIIKFLQPLVWYGESKLGAKAFGLSLKVRDSCIKCNKCVNNCPSNNITLRDEKLYFSNKCIWCMKCIYACPSKAIYSRGMNVFILKAGYDIETLLKSPVQYNTEDGKIFKKYMNDLNL